MGEAARLLIDRGASLDARDAEGRTALMLAASSDVIPVDTVELLVAHGAAIDARSASGDTAFDFARRRGRTAVVDLLASHGARPAAAPGAATPAFTPAASPRAAIERSVPCCSG